MNAQRTITSTFLVLALMGTLLVMGARAADPIAEFNAGNVAYEQGKYAEAAAHYESAATNGAPTAAAWFNLGNAKFKVGELGRALAAWRRAEHLTPRDPALRANLDFVRRKIYGEDAHTPTLRMAARFFTPNEWATAGAALVLSVFLVLAWNEWRRNRAPVGIVVVISVLAVATSSFAFASHADATRRQGVVISKQSAVRLGPLDDSQVAFQLPDGFEVDIIDSTSEWYQIRSATGRTGWARRSDFALVSP